MKSAKILACENFPLYGSTAEDVHFDEQALNTDHHGVGTIDLA